MNSVFLNIYFQMNLIASCNKCSRKILFRTVYNETKMLLRERGQIDFRIGSHRENDNFCNNSGTIWPTLLIFEVERGIVKTKLCRKFHCDRTLPSKVMQTAGSTHTDRI